MQSPSDEARQQASTPTISQSYYYDMALRGSASHSDHMEISPAFSQSTYPDMGSGDRLNLNTVSMEPFESADWPVLRQRTSSPVIENAPVDNLVTPLDETFASQVDGTASETKPHNVNHTEIGNHCPARGSILPLLSQDSFVLPEPHSNDHVHQDFPLASTSVAGQDDFVASLFEGINAGIPIPYSDLTPIPTGFDNEIRVPAVQTPTGFACGQPGCSRIFSRKADRTRHLASVHRINATMHLCPVQGCSKSHGRGYYRANMLTEHMWRKHGDLRFRKGGQ